MATTEIQRLGMDPQIEPDALPCPFCGSPATIQYWHGGGAFKRLIVCSDPDDNPCEVVPSITGETRAEALRHWNRRFDPIRETAKKLGHQLMCAPLDRGD